MVTKTKSSTKRDTKADTKISTCEAIQISIRMGVFIALALFLLTGVWGIHRYLYLSQNLAEMSFTGTDEMFIPNSTAEITFSFSDLQEDASKARDTVTTRVERRMPHLHNQTVFTKRMFRRLATLSTLSMRTPHRKYCLQTL